MFERIVVAVDGSQPADNALATALKLAKGQRAKLRIVHVVDTLPPANVTGAGEMYVDIDAYREAAISAGRDVIRRAGTAATAARVRPETALVEIASRDASGAIIDEARRWRADLIVLGTHGRTGLARLLLGSVAEGVARHSPVAVLLVRAGGRRTRVAPKAAGPKRVRRR